MWKICSHGHTILCIIFECLIRRRCYLLRLNIASSNDVQNKRKTFQDYVTLLRNGSSCAFICHKPHGRPLSYEDLFVNKIYSKIQNNFGNGTKVI